MTTVPQHDAAALENERPLSVEQQQTEARLINSDHAAYESRLSQMLSSDPSLSVIAAIAGNNVAPEVRTSSEASAPVGVVPRPMPASIHQPSLERDKPNPTQGMTGKFKLKRTGTSGLPPGHVLSHGPTNTATKPSAPPSSSRGIDAPVEQIKHKTGTMQNAQKTFEDGLEIDNPRPSLSSTPGASRPTSAGKLSSEVSKTATPQSIAMKRKWASGQMDGVAQRAAQTRKLNAERRKSIISISGDSTPEPAVASSTSGPPSAKKPSLADYYRMRADKTAALLSTDGPVPRVATNVMPPQAETGPSATNVSTEKMHPPKEARNPSPPHVQDTPYPRSRSGRPYDMAPNESGRLVYGFGALFPDGYAPSLEADGKGSRWTCPVRDCNQERSYMKSHGKHFLKGHKSALLRDNEDGTFTVTGYNLEREAPVVVSRGPAGNTPNDPFRDVAAEDDQPESPEDVNQSEPQLRRLGKTAIGYADRQTKQSGQIPELDAPFAFTPSGRSYLTLPDGGGRTFGVPIPDGYENTQKHNMNTPEKPWICPIRSCLSDWGSQAGLCIHFGRMHRRTLVNDNLDGTLSVIGRRDDDARYQSVRHLDQKDALVVKQGPFEDIQELAHPFLDHPSQLQRHRKQDRPEMGEFLAVTPEVVRAPPSQSTTDTHDHPPGSSTQPPSPQRKTHDVPPASHAQPSSSQLRHHYLTPASHAQPIQTLEGGALEIWNYIRPHLSSFTECPDSSWIPELLELPKVRDIVWNNTFVAHNVFKDKVSRDVATLIMQVTGEIPDKTCSRCRDGKGPYGECIVISSEAPIDARLAFAACASCIYNGQGTYCTLKFNGKKKAEEAAESMRLSGATYDADADVNQSNMSSISGSQAQGRIHEQSPVRRSERVQVKEAIAQSVPATTPISGRDDIPDAPYIPYEGEAPLPPDLPPPQHVLHTLDGPSKQQSQPLPTNTDEMEIEDWELAPGLLRSKAPQDDNEPAENIGYSRTYLTAAQSVRVNEDTTVRVEVVGSGSTLRWAATPDRIRCGFVVAGKVKVRVEGEDEFDLGPQGMFRLLPGKSCVVLNKLYGNATLHVTEVKEYN